MPDRRDPTESHLRLAKHPNGLVKEYAYPKMVGFDRKRARICNNVTQANVL